MWELLGDLLTIAVVLLVIWSFVPARSRARTRVALGALWQTLRPFAYRAITGSAAPQAGQRRTAMEQLPVDRRGSESLNVGANRTPPFAPANGERPRSDAAEQPAEPVRSVRAPADALTLTREEIGAVARMIAHNKSAARPTKSSAIEAGFGLKRGGGPAYARASAIYDRLFAAPNEALYPTLVAEREKVGREVETVQGT